MLRSPTHIVGHGPTSTHATATSTNPVVKNSSPLHRHIGQNIATTMTTTATTTMTTKNGIILNGGNNKSYNNLNNNNNNNNNSNNNNHTSTASSSSTSSQTAQTTTRTSLFDSCHRKIRLIGGGPVAFLGGLVAKARRKERDGDQSSTDTKLYLEESVLERKLPDADLKALVDLPAGLDYNEWLASHTLALFEHVNLVYGTISEFCTPSGCPDMTGPANRTYLWFDEKGKKTRVAAPQYIDYVMTFTQKTVSDESIFPTKYANEFPSSFESIARKILRLQFHVIAHLYAAHFREIALLGLHTHLNLTFAHLTALHRRFNLIDEKETDVLRDLEIALRLTDDGSNCSMSGGVGGASNGGSGTGSTVGSGSCSGSGGSSCTGNNGTASSGIGGLSNISLASDSIISSSQLSGTTGMAVTTMTGTVIGTSEDINLLQCGRIDGDATIKPICTQPEGMKGGFNNDRMDIRHIGVGGGVGSCLIGGNSLIGAGGNSIVGGILGSFTSDLIDTGYCSSNSGGNVNTNNIGGINNTSSNNSSHIGNVLSFNNNHHSSTHNALTANSILQCNSNNSPSSHTTTTA